MLNDLGNCVDAPKISPSNTSEAPLTCNIGSVTISKITIS